MTAAPAVVLLHGLRTSASMWRHQVEALDHLGIPVIAVDLPGHGSRIGEAFGLEAALAAIDAAVADGECRTGSPPYLVGFSLGGYLAMEWVAAHPGRVVGLLAAACATTPHPLIMRVWRVLARVIHLLPDRGRRLNDSVVRMFVPMPGAADVLAGGVALEVMDDTLRVLADFRPVETLRSITVPVLFVNGAFDHIRIEARRFLRAAQNSRLVTVPRASHMVSVTAPDVFTELLLDGYREASIAR